MCIKENLGKNLGKSRYPQTATFFRYWVLGGAEVDDEMAARELDEFIQNLELAHTHAQRALDALYRPTGPQRSTLYRMALGRAQSRLISLYVKEIQKRSQRGTSD